MEKSRLSARQKDRNSGIILSYKSTKKATFFLLKKARRCARVPSDMSSSICRSPELASVSRYRLAAATWLRQRIHALSYDWRAHKSHAPDQPGCRGLGAVLYQTKAKVRNIQLQGHNFKFTQSLASSAKTRELRMIGRSRIFAEFIIGLDPGARPATDPFPSSTRCQSVSVFLGQGVGAAAQ